MGERRTRRRNESEVVGEGEGMQADWAKTVSLEVPILKARRSCRENSPLKWSKNYVYLARINFNS